MKNLCVSAVSILLAAVVGLTSTAPLQAQVQSPPDFVIGPEDVLGVVFWRDQEMSGDVSVRPDGMITLPLLGDLKASDLRPEQLKDVIEKAAARFLTEPSVTVIVREIKSRQVFITGEVLKPGPYPLTSPKTVMQLIAIAGGLNEYADAKNISVMRSESGQQRAYKFNYRAVAEGRDLAQNIQLRPGDTVVVP
jgi:polysaccharide export outer membrane protein